MYRMPRSKGWRMIVMALAVLYLGFGASAAHGNDFELYEYTHFYIEGNNSVVADAMLLGISMPECDWYAWEPLPGNSCWWDNSAWQVNVGLQIADDWAPAAWDYGEWSAHAVYPAVYYHTYTLDVSFQIGQVTWYFGVGYHAYVTHYDGSASGQYSSEIEFEPTELPTIAYIDPNEGYTEDNGVSIYICGQYFSPDYWKNAVSVSGGGVSISNCQVDGGGLACLFSIDQSAQPGQRNLKVTVNGHPSNEVTFTVKAGPRP